MKTTSKAVSETTVHKLFRYGTHEQLENSVNRWLKKGIATQTFGKWYDIDSKLVKDSIELEINVKGKYGSPVWQACAVVVKDNKGWYLLAGSL
jgi:hypothetical protein